MYSRPRRRRSIVPPAILLVFLALISFQTATAQNDSNLRTNTYFVNHVSSEPFYAEQGLDPNVVIHVREVILEGRERSVPNDGKVLLLVHGRTVPGYVGFDLPCEDCSMMRYFARAGWDVFTLDLEGYGRSTRPLIMENPDAFPDSTAPIHVEVGVSDITRVVEFITNLRGVHQVHLLGWSYGATCEAPRYAGEYPASLASLTLFGGAYRSLGEEDRFRADPETIEALENEIKVLRGSPIQGSYLGTAADAYVPGLPETYRAAHLASDPRSGEFGGRFRVPAGRDVDASGQRPCFDAEGITAPTLVIRGEDDTFAVPDDNEQLVEDLGSDVAEYVEIADAGHLTLWEEGARVEFFEEVLDFLEANPAQDP